MYAANPGLLEAGKGMTGSNLVIPQDITQLAVTSATTTSAANVPTTATGGAYGDYGSGAVTTSAASSQATGAAAGSLAASKSGSGRLVTSSVMVGLVALVASLAAL